jgi:hypothetical protein
VRLTHTAPVRPWEGAADQAETVAARLAESAPVADLPVTDVAVSDDGYEGAQRT